MTYGPGQAPTKLIPSVALALLQGERPRLSSGRHRSDWVYISDVIEGFVAAATVSGIEGKTIDLGSGTLTPPYATWLNGSLRLLAMTSSLNSVRSPIGPSKIQ